MFIQKGMGFNTKKVQFRMIWGTFIFGNLHPCFQLKTFHPNLHFHSSAAIRGKNLPISKKYANMEPKFARFFISFHINLVMLRQTQIKNAVNIARHWRPAIFSAMIRHIPPLSSHHAVSYMQTVGPIGKNHQYETVRLHLMNASPALPTPGLFDSEITLPSGYILGLTVRGLAVHWGSCLQHQPKHRNCWWRGGLVGSPGMPLPVAYARMHQYLNHTHIYINMFLGICMYVRMHACMHACTCLYVCMDTWMHVCMYVCMYVM